MSGFRTRSTVQAAWDWLDSAVNQFPTHAELIPIAQSYGRVLAQSVISTLNVPEFDRSAMDGYAVIADETNGASPYNPRSLRVIGQALPGQAFHGQLRSQQAIRIMTGAPLPNGADAVVPVEYTTPDGEFVQIATAVGPQKHVGKTGEDIQTGAEIVAAGRKLRPQDVAVIASVGQSTVTVRRRPRVRIIITGNELVRPGEKKQRHQIYEANSSLLLGMIPRDGGVLESLRFVEDQEAAISAALLEPGADLILVSGGSSVGAEDFAPGLVARLGELPIHGIAMRPSSPTGLGRVGSSLTVLLPGNPVSCLCAYDFFAGRALRSMAGLDPGWPFRTVAVPLAKKVVSAIGRVDYCRIRIAEGLAIPLAISGASILSSTTRADGFLLVPEESEGLPAGATVHVLLYS